MDELTKEIPSFKEALKVSIRKSGKTEKQFYLELEIDCAQWSRIMSGQGHFPENKLVKFLEIAENNIPLEWLAHQRGHEIRPIPKFLEERLLEKERENLDLKSRLEHLEGLIKEKFKG